MKILHLSDTHGVWPEPPAEDFDVVVHSGDVLPNASYGTRAIEEAFQPRWLEAHAPKIPRRYFTKPVLITPGNHDFIDPTPILRAAGMNARRLCNEALTLDGVTFWGHPWTPTFYDWNWMCEPEAMARHLAPIAERLEGHGGIDVLVSHGPMRGVLDRNADGEPCGCPLLRMTLDVAPHPPAWLLHGHIHESPGTATGKHGLRVSNAARTRRVVMV